MVPLPDPVDPIKGSGCLLGGLELVGVHLTVPTSLYSNNAEGDGPPRGVSGTGPVGVPPVGHPALVAALAPPPRSLPLPLGALVREFPADFMGSLFLAYVGAVLVAQGLSPSAVEDIVGAHGVSTRHQCVSGWG